ncbi:MAG: Mur ligase family protein [Oscillospiraceae bacterium]|nr:Mur ligase family protein [Oscillospiraceae bacterium]
MFSIKLRTFFGIVISKSSLFFLKTFFKSGTSLPGKLALLIDKGILKYLSKDINVIIVTGTNGKTTTSAMINEMLINNGYHSINNSSGANMLTGIVTCFLENHRFFKEKAKYAVIETDEAFLKIAMDSITPSFIVVTNLFRDQLDRYGEVYTTFNYIMDGIKKVPSSTLVLNADESLLGKLDVDNPKIYYGFNYIPDVQTENLNIDTKYCKFCKTEYKYIFNTYNHLGNYYCENCGYKRPDLNYSLDYIESMSPNDSRIVISGKQYRLIQPGLYNIYNALAAYSVAKSLNLSEIAISETFKRQVSKFGRQEIFLIDEKKAKIILIKNPAGCDSVIDTLCLEKNEFILIAMLNDNFADGQDVSWIWDTKFEKLTSLNIKEILIGGRRLYDMCIRFKIAGFKEDIIKPCTSNEIILNSIKESNIKNIYILCTYTAMLSFRKFLYTKGYIKDLWR